MDDEFWHFLAAQSPVWEAVTAELAAGRKQTHWMWFIFPQLAGLGHSAMSRRYALHSLAEASGYLRHPVLGARLGHCVGLVNAVEGISAHDIFGAPDDMKFQSSMTLFALAAPEEAAFRTALDKYYGGREDRGTIALLERHHAR